MKKVLWVSNEPGWAYDINAQTLSKKMPQYNHFFLYTVYKGREDADLITPQMDVVVALNPLSFYMYSNFKKVVTTLNSHRALVDTRKEHLSEVAAIICANKMLYDFAITQNKNVYLCPEGLDLDDFKPKENNEKNTIFTTGFAGQITGSYALFKGWPFYQDACNEIGNNIKQLNLIYGVNQLPPNKMVIDFYYKIDCLVLLSESEGCSSVIMEALACGIPVICTKVGYHGHTLTDGKQCIFVERNYKSVKDAILKLKNDLSFYKNMQAEARKFASECHNINVVAKLYADVFEGI